MTKYNVLQFIYKLEVGGAERVVCALATGLDKSRYNCIVASCKGGPLEEYLRQQDIPVHVLGKRGKLDFLFFLSLLRLLRNRRIDILHTHTFTPNLWGRMAAFLLRIPVVISTEHTIASHKAPWQRRADKVLSSISDAIIAVSHEVKQTLVSLGKIDSSKIIIIHNGVDNLEKGTISDCELDGLKKSLNLKTELPVVLTVGRLSPPKGHSCLLEAAEIVNKGEVRAQFVFVGDGPLRRELTEKVLELGLEEYVLFLGFRSDVHNLLKVADIVVFPSLREGFSIAVLEAMSTGKPIVATDVGGNREAIKSGVSGLLVPPGDVEALARAISELLTNDDIALKLGREAKKRLESEFTVDRMVYETEKTYTHFIDKRLKSKT